MTIEGTAEQKQKVKPAQTRGVNKISKGEAKGETRSKPHKPRKKSHKTQDLNPNQGILLVFGFRVFPVWEGAAILPYRSRKLPILPP